MLKQRRIDVDATSCAHLEESIKRACYFDLLKMFLVLKMSPVQKLVINL